MNETPTTPSCFCKIHTLQVRGSSVGKQRGMAMQAVLSVPGPGTCSTWYTFVDCFGKSPAKNLCSIELALARRDSCSDTPLQCQGDLVPLKSSRELSQDESAKPAQFNNVLVPIISHSCSRSYRMRRDLIGFHGV
jgi:hypothetical protein